MSRSVEERLARGQEPLDTLARARTAHEVRTLRPCAVCQNIGNTHSMIDSNKEWFHGRCFVARFGGKALGALPESKTGRLTLGDLGVALMKALCNHRDRP